MKLAIFVVCLAAFSTIVYWAIRLAFPQLSQRSRVFSTIGFIVGSAVLLVSIDSIVAFLIADSISDDIKTRLGTHPLLVTVVFFGSAVVLQLLWWYLVVQKAALNLFLVVVTGVAPALYFLFLYNATKDDWFEISTGESAKCFVVTREAVRYFPYDSKLPRYDSTTGAKCEPVTPTLVSTLSALDSRLKSKQPIAPVDETLKEWFSATGEPLLWTGTDDNGIPQFFEFPGFHPRTGVQLVAVTKELRATWMAHLAKQEQQRRQRMADDALETSKREVAESRRKELVQLRERFGVDSFVKGSALTVILPEKTDADSDELADHLVNSYRIGSVLGSSSRVGREIAKAIASGKVQELADAGLLERVATVRVLGVSAACRSTASVAGGFVCAASVDEQVTTSRSPSVRRRKHFAELSGVSKKDSFESISIQLSKEL